MREEKKRGQASAVRSPPFLEERIRETNL